MWLLNSLEKITVNIERQASQARAKKGICNARTPLRDYSRPLHCFTEQCSVNVSNPAGTFSILLKRLLPRGNCNWMVEFSLNLRRRVGSHSRTRRRPLACALKMLTNQSTPSTKDALN